MQTAYTAPVLATPSGESRSGEPRTITMGRNRLNTIENWVKPLKPSRSVAVHAELAEPAERTDRAEPEPSLNEPVQASGNPGLPRPVSQFLRHTGIARI